MSDFRAKMHKIRFWDPLAVFKGGGIRGGRRKREGEERERKGKRRGK